MGSEMCIRDRFRRVRVMQCYGDKADGNPLFVLLEGLDVMDIPDGLYKDRHDEEATFDINVIRKEFLDLDFPRNAWPAISFVASESRCSCSMI